MKSNSIVKSIGAAALLTGVSLSLALGGDKEQSQSQLEAKAKVTKAEAEKTAMAKAPDGKVKDAELEAEHGKLIWSFDIARPGSKGIIEVQVDAITGKVANVEIEKAKDQAKEADEAIPVPVFPLNYCPASMSHFCAATRRIAAMWTAAV